MTEISKLAVVAEDVEIGDGCRIGDFVKLYPGTWLGNRVEFDEYSNSSGAVIVGDDCKIKKTAIVGQGSIVEEKCWLGPFAILIHELHAHWHQPAIHVSMGCYLHAGAVIGAHAQIMAGVTIGYNAEIGCGATVVKDCEENGIYVNRAHKSGAVYADRVGTVPPERRVKHTPHEPWMFGPRILERYLPDLVKVGKYDVVA